MVEMQSVYIEWTQYVGNDEKIQEQFQRIYELVQAAHDPVALSKLTPKVISEKDSPKAIAERRAQITLLQEGIVTLKERFITRHGVKKEDIRTDPNYQRLAGPIQHARTLLSQQRRGNR